MQRTGRKLRKTLKALTDPQPEFVSLVFGGANKSPFRAIRADGALTGEGNDMNTEVTIKAETHEIARVEFSGEMFADETAVKAWLADGGYSDELLVIKTDSGFEVSDPAITPDTELSVIDLSDITGVKVHAVKTADAPIEDEVLELTEKAESEDLNPGAIDARADITGVADMRQRSEEFTTALIAAKDGYDAMPEPDPAMGVGETLNNTFAGVPPGLLDVTMALYSALRNNLIADNVDGARECIAEYSELFDKLVALFPDDDADGDDGDDTAMKDDMSMGDVANNLQNAAMGLKPKKSKPSVANVEQNTDDKIVADGSKDKISANPKDAHEKGKLPAANGGIDGPGTANADHNTDDKIKPNSPVKPGTKVHGEQNVGGKINPNGNLEAVANPNSAHGNEPAPKVGKGPLKPTMKAAMLAAAAPEIEVSKEEIETAEKAGKKTPPQGEAGTGVEEEKAADKGPKDGTDDEKKPGGDDMTNDQGDRSGKPTSADDAEGDVSDTDGKDKVPSDDSEDGGADAPAKKKKEDEEVSDEAVEAVKSEDPMALLTALVGTLAVSVKAMQDSISERHEEVVQRVAAMEDVRQTRKGADVDETGTASPTAASENSRKMANLRTDSVLGRRRPYSG